MKQARILQVGMILAFTFCCCQATSPVAQERLVLQSNAFKQKGGIPKKYTCDGANVSPALSWQDVPEGTESFVIICYDSHPVANNWVHWLVYNIPVGTVKLEEGRPNVWKLEEGILQGKSTFGNAGYGGPCPPPGSGIHHYHFLIYALDIPKLEFEKDMKLIERVDIDKAMEGHIIGEGELVGTYEK